MNVAVLIAVFLGVCVAVLLWVVFCQLRQVSSLHAWLKDPKQHTVPNVAHCGNWQGIYDELTRLENSRQKRAERLNHTVHRLNRMMTAIPSAVLIINQKGGIEWKNAKADEYLSLQNNKLPIHKQIPDDNFVAFLNDNGKGESKGVGMEKKLTLNQKTLLCTLIPIEANATMLIAHDMSASEHLNISKNAFIANVSHELRTPLTVIQGFLETLSDNELERELELEFIGLMQKQSERMLDLIEGLLTLSRLENDDSPIQEPINLSELINSIVKDASRLSDTHHMTVQIEDGIWVMGAYKELYSAFSNLIFNAVRHTESGTNIDVHLSVQKGDAEHESEAVFFVKDDGDGISSEHLTHLTERFYRVDKGRSRKTGGSGLGLAIVKHVLARHHAVLTIESEVGKGSKFEVKMACDGTVPA